MGMKALDGGKGTLDRAGRIPALPTVGHEVVDIAACNAVGVGDTAYPEKSPHTPQDHAGIL